MKTDLDYIADCLENLGMKANIADVERKFLELKPEQDPAAKSQKTQKNNERKALKAKECECMIAHLVMKASEELKALLKGTTNQHFPAGSEAHLSGASFTLPRQR